MDWLLSAFGVGPKGLEKILFRYPDQTPYTVRDSLEHTQLFGRSGSGKSSGGLKHYVKACVDNPASGGLWLSSKPEDREFVEKVFRNRRDDLIIFGEEETPRYALMEDLKDTREIVKFITSAKEIVGRMSSQRGGDEYWFSEMERALYNSAEMIRLAYGKVSAPAIQKYFLDAALTPEALLDPDWKEGVHHQTNLKAQAHVNRPRPAYLTAAERARRDIERHDFELCVDYWTKEYPAMASKQRSGIIGMTTSAIHPLNTGLFREIFSTTTTVTPAVMGEGKWIFADFNPEDATGRCCLLALKYAAQRWALNRVNPKTPSYIIIDECQNLVNWMDAEFMAKARSHWAGQLMATQSVNSYFGVMPGDKGAAQVKSILANCGTKVFHQANDDETAEYAQKLIGNYRESFVSLAPTDASPYEVMKGDFQMKPNYSEQWQPIMQTNEFFDGFRTGGRCGVVDGIVVSSRPFADGSRVLKMGFKQ